MTNGERIMRDIALIVRDYENKRVKDSSAIEKINELTEQNCKHCVFKGECPPDTTVTCYTGFRRYLSNDV